jgi:hypothetical protein
LEVERRFFSALDPAQQLLDGAFVLEHVSSGELKLHRIRGYHGTGANAILGGLQQWKRHVKVRSKGVIYVACPAAALHGSLHVENGSMVRICDISELNCSDIAPQAQDELMQAFCWRVCQQPPLEVVTAQQVSSYPADAPGYSSLPAAGVWLHGNHLSGAFLPHDPAIRNVSNMQP